MITFKKVKGKKKYNVYYTSCGSKCGSINYRHGAWEFSAADGAWFIEELLLLLAIKLKRIERN